MAVALAIVLLSGDGDGFRVYRETLQTLREGVRDAVPEAPERRAALDAVDRLEAAVTEHWDDLRAAGDCVEAADRRYAATLDDYGRCRRRFDAAFSTAAERYVEARASLDATVPDAVWADVEASVRKAVE